MKKWLIAIPLALALGLGVAACGSDDDSAGGSSGLSGEIAGAGASSQEAAMNGWIVGFQESNPDVNISYDPVGSGGGREQFLAGGTSFGGTDSAMDEDELKTAAERCTPGDYIEIPAYISPIAVAYNVEGVEELNLDPSTMAQIMNGKITNWDDQAIAAENPDATLPDQRITVVHRSDESGTTENFADYLSQAAPKDWPHEVDGYWPVKGGEAAQGTSGVISAINAGSGTIGYADLSQVGELGTVNIKVGEEYTTPSPESAAQIVDVSERVKGGGKYVFAFDLARDTTEEGIYPISLVSYEMACTHYDDENEAALVKALYSYIISPEGQDAAASAAGSAPISDTLREQISPAVEAIGTK
ncbi:MAG: phosphate ABC transporter substrate-binding protein PstS [Actinomycetota bacterium]|nr:phosphate ABC transporter substrate-binding protein PstS [Actinomycetota bacterium]